MVDLDYLKNINLVPYSHVQRFIANFLLTPNYYIISKVDIRLENDEHIPRDENVIFAMNHTDRFNYWPFQYKLWQMKVFPETTVWVKGKYYRNTMMAKALDLCNLIPVPSMGYLIQEFYRKKYMKVMDRELYRKVKDAIDGKGEDTISHNANLTETAALMGESFMEFMRDYYEQIMEHVAKLTRIALFENRLSLIIFPEGTRGTQLGEGKTGIAQVALHTGKTIVPIGCNNSDKVYPGSSPVAKSGTIIYRVGEPLSVKDRLKEFKIDEPFKLLSRESQIKYKKQFEGATKIIMAGINQMLDEQYRKDFAAS